MKKDLQLLLEADWTLSKCGRPTPPKGLSTVPIPHSFLLQTLDLTSGQTTIEKTVTGDTTWMLRAISANGVTPYWQVILLWSNTCVPASLPTGRGTRGWTRFSRRWGGQEPCGPMGLWEGRVLWTAEVW
jgi:hypothetical protein